MLAERFRQGHRNRLGEQGATRGVDVGAHACRVHRQTAERIGHRPGAPQLTRRRDPAVCPTPPASRRDRARVPGPSRLAGWRPGRACEARRPARPRPTRGCASAASSTIRRAPRLAARSLHRSRSAPAAKCRVRSCRQSRSPRQARSQVARAGRGAHATGYRAPRGQVVSPTRR